MSIIKDAATTGEHRAVETGEPPLSLAEAKAWLRLATDDDDALVAGLVAVAADMCERFTGQLLIARGCRSVVAAGGEWRRLGLGPVRDVTGVSRIDENGAETVLADAAYEADIDADGDGWVRLRGSVSEARIAVAYRAGLAEAAEDLPAALGQGMLRMVGHLYATRGEGEAAPPAAVAALWRPWRRMRL